jgi:hypothetical protein
MKRRIVTAPRHLNALEEGLRISFGDTDRAAQYGPPREDWQRAVNLFRNVTGNCVVDTPPRVALFMACIKLARIGQVERGLAPHKQDSVVDLDVYMAHYGEMMEGRE